MFFSSIGAPLSRLLQLFAWVMLATALVAAQVHAQQQYKEMPASPDAPTWPKVGTYAGHKDVQEMLKGNNTLDPVAFDKYFLQILFPQFTRSENFQNFATRTDLPKMRRTVRSDLVAAKNPQAHERLNEKTLEFMDAVAQDTYAPVARANAMMMIADLNDTDPGGAPWKKALPALVKGVTAPTTIDSVRVPALRGLLRHALAGIDSDAKPQVMAAMQAILNERTPPADRTADGQDWISRRAIDVLVAMGEPGANGAVADALQKIVDDNSASVSLRSAAAGALANPKLTPPPGLDAGNLAKSMGKLAVEAYKGELAEASSQFKAIAADRLKQHLNEIRHGLVGDGGKGGVLGMSAAGPPQDFVNSLAKQIDALLTACNTQTLTQPIPPMTVASAGTPVIPIDTQEPLAKAINQAGGNLEAVLQRGEGAAPAEAPPGTPPGMSPPKKTPAAAAPAGTVPQG